MKSFVTEHCGTLKSAELSNYRSMVHKSRQRVANRLIWDEANMKAKNLPNYDPVHFCVAIDNRQYILAGLNISKKKKEVFVKIYYEEEFRGVEQRYTDEIGDTSAQGITDHISFHKDGTVHITSKKYKGTVHRRNAANVEGGVFDLPDEEVVPFLFLSFMLKDNEYRLPFKHINQRNHVWELTKKTNVGLIFYVLHKKYIKSFFAKDGTNL